MQLSAAEPLTLGEVFVMVLVTVMVRSVGAVAVTFTEPLRTQVATPESLIPAIAPFEVAQVSPSAWVNVRLE